jgi:hypothetical protein
MATERIQTPAFIQPTLVSKNNATGRVVLFLGRDVGLATVTLEENGGKLKGNGVKISFHFRSRRHDKALNR